MCQLTDQCFSVLRSFGGRSTDTLCDQLLGQFVTVLVLGFAVNLPAAWEPVLTKIMQ